MFTDNPQGPERVIDLQLFGEEPTETSDAPVEPVESQPQATQEEEPTYESLAEFLEQYESDEPMVEEPTEMPEEAPEGKTAEEQMILGKFKTQEDLVDAYQEAERRISAYGQDGAKARQDLEQLRGQVSQLQSFLTQQRYRQAQQPQQFQPTEEEIAEQNQKWLDKFYEDPLNALNEEVEKRVKKAVEPMQRDYQVQQAQRRYQQQVEEARQKYPDFDDLQPQMQDIVKEQGQYIASLPNAVEAIYGMAKARVPQSQPQDTESLLQNEEVRQRILKDEGIKKAILQQYAQEVKQKQPPPVMGKQSGEPASAPPEQIYSTKDAKKASLSFFQRFAGGGQK